MKIVQVPIGQVRPAKYNPRKDLQPGDPEYEKIKRSIEEFGLVDPLVLNSHNNVLVGGHQRLKVLKDLGWKDVPVSIVTIKDDNREKALNIALNRIQGDWDDDALANLLDSLIKSDHFDVSLTGFDQKEIDRLIDNLRSDIGDEADQIPEPPKKPVTKPGDVWKIGNHHLICGDSTDPKILKKLEHFTPPSLTFTSPPYWVGMEYETQKSIKEVDDFISSSVSTINHVMSKNNSRVIINTGSGNAKFFTGQPETIILIDKWINALRSHGWLLRHLRYWVKHGGLPASISPKTDMIDQHCELIGTFFYPKGQKRGMNKIDEAWAQQGFIDDLKGDKSAGGVHCAAFPVELPRRFIRLYSAPGETVFDLFGGSGTTMLAAEFMERKSILVELSPAYADVAIERMKNNFEKVVAKRL